MHPSLPAPRTPAPGPPARKPCSRQDGTREGRVSSMATSVLGMRGDKGNGNPLPISSREPQWGGGGSPWEQPSREYRSNLKNDPNPVYSRARDPRQEEGEKSCQHPLLKETRAKQPRGPGGVVRRRASALRMLRAATRPGCGGRTRGPAIGLVGAQRRVYLHVKSTFLAF